METKLVGKLVWWSRDKNCGTIAVRNGAKLERYFAHMGQVVFCEPDEPSQNCLVTFEIDRLHPPKRPTDLWSANSIEIFNPRPESETKGGLSKLAGEQEGGK